MNSPGDGAAPLDRFYAYKNTFDNTTTWVDIPRDLTFYNTTDPYTDDVGTPSGQGRRHSQDHTSYMQSQAQPWNIHQQSQLPSGLNPHGLEALSAAALYSPATANLVGRPSSSSNHENPSRSTPVPDHSSDHLGSPESPNAPNNNLNYILNSPPNADSPIDPSLMSSLGTSMAHHPNAPSSPLKPPAATMPAGDLAPIEGAVEPEHKMAYLLRHFSETPGQWMDLFDLGCYFSHHVPFKARSLPLLKYAACAYAAKQLFRAKGKKAVYGGVAGNPAHMETFDDPTVDWEWEGALYYDRSIGLLKEEIQDQNTIRSDEVIAASAILSVYEFISDNGSAWSRHLNGTKSLLDIVEDSMMPIEVPGSYYPTVSPRRQPSTARRATFWNFARQDYIAAFINDSHTRLDTEDLQMWRDAGLQLTEQGDVMPSDRSRHGVFEGETVGEDMFSNALVWLSSRICNYLASGEVFEPTPAGDKTEIPRMEVGLVGESQVSLLQRWGALETALEIWHDGLPATFQPSARIKTAGRDLGCRYDASLRFEEIWYVMPMCAATMQHYHMARILLLINKPHETTAGRSTIGDRIGSYRAIDREATWHCYEICGIALARPPASVRVHSTQPLFVAGQYFEQSNERQVVLDLLRSIKDDLGWSTEDRVQQLLKQWGWDGG